MIREYEHTVIHEYRVNKRYTHTENHKIVNGWLPVKRCRACGQWKPYSGYSKDKAKKDGLYPYCRACKEWLRDNKYQVHTVKATDKPCITCRVVKPPEAYCKDKTHKDGLRSECRICRSHYQREWKERQDR